jgi:hypothetical protein
MTEKECLRQVKRLMGSWKTGGLAVLMQEADRLIRSGGIELSEEEKDSYFAAKIILHVALENLSAQFRPISATGNEIAENLRHF